MKELIIYNIMEVSTMKKFIKTIVFILGISLILTNCTTEKVKEEPEISLKFNISDLTEEEFKLVGTKEVENPTKYDFKKIEFKLDVEHSNKISNRKIIVPNIKEVINSKYEERYWFGEGSAQDNEGENFAEYSEKIIFYSKGLNEEEIKEVFKSLEVKISWKTNNGENKEKIFNLYERKNQ